jgi:hypothetical protein
MDQVKTFENDIASMTHPLRLQDALQLISDPTSITQAQSTTGDSIKHLPMSASNIPALQPITTTPATSRHLDGYISSSCSVSSAVQVQREPSPTDATHDRATSPRKKRKIRKYNRYINPGDQIEDTASGQDLLQDQSSLELRRRDHNAQ